MRVRIVEKADGYWKYSWAVEKKHWFTPWRHVVCFNSNIADVKEEAMRYAHKLLSLHIEEIT